jgi:hypothetical protein
LQLAHVQGMAVPLANSTSYRGGQHDRRRRLLTDELSHSSQWPVYRTAADEDALLRKTSHYGNAEFLEEPAGLLNLIPRQPWTLMLALLAGLALSTGLELVYDWMAGHYAASGTLPAALDLNSKGSLGNWYSSLILLAAASVALIVYSVRRHRIDDYQGRYRIWLWAAACWFLLATDQAASLREGFRELMIGLTGSRLFGCGDIWWASVYTLLLGSVGSRLIIDMRANWPAMISLVLAGMVSGLAMAMRLGLTWLEPGKHEIMLRAGIEMGSSLLVLATMCLHARHVIFDAEGLLPSSEADADEESDLEADEDFERRDLPGGGDAWLKIDSAHVKPHPTSHSKVSRAAPAPVSRTSDLPPVQRKLTKAERKALKQRLLRERMEREQQM